MSRHPLKETPPWPHGEGWKRLWEFWTPYERL